MSTQPIPWTDLIVKTPGTCGGHARIAGTRLEVKHVYRYWMPRTIRFHLDEHRRVRPGADGEGRVAFTPQGRRAAR